MVEKLNRHGETVSRSSDGGTVGHVMVEHWNIWWWNSRSSYGGTVEQRWFNTRTVEHWNRGGGTVKHLIVEQSNVWWWKSGTETVEQSNILWWNSWTSDGGTVEHLMVEQWNIRWWNSRTSDGGRVEQRWRNIRSSDCATVEERLWNSGTSDGGTMEQIWWNAGTSYGGTSDSGTMFHLMVAWLPEWHNYAECHMHRIIQRNKLNWKFPPFLAPINLQTELLF